MNRTFPLPSMLALGAVTTTLLASQAAFAQYGTPGGMMPGMPPPNRGMAEEPREEGPAERAPEEEVRPSDLEPLGAYPEQRRRRTQIFELDGYFRTRGEWMNKLNLGQGYQTLGGGELRPPPFPLPLSCGLNQTNAGACDSQTLGSADMRLRLEPTIHVTEQVRVMSQIDVFDNVVMGSTPESLVNATQYSPDQPDAVATTPPTSLNSGAAPTDLQSMRQEPPEAGRNGVITSIRAKRAWGEVDTPFFTLRFGRMPWHFGRGMLFNRGNCADCEYGTTVDRLALTSRLLGHQVGVSWDFGPQGPNTAWTYLGQRDPQMTAIDLGNRDDVYQLTATIVRSEDDARFKERVARGDKALNYGFQLVYRDQTHAVFNTPQRMGADPGGALTPEDLQQSTAYTRNVDAMMFIPDFWLKFGYRQLTLELEAAAVLGKMDKSPQYLSADGGSLDFKQFGWVAAADLSFVKNTLFVGFETGGATGDQAENKRGYLNYNWRTVQQPRGDRNVGDFHFSPDYHVDQILFRRIMGTVSNAIYFKPQLAYWLNLAEPRQLGITAAAIYSGALVPVSTPGNQFSYGLELNAGLTYRNPADGFYTGLVWGVLFPMGALDRLGVSTNQQTISRQDAGTAQVIRLFAGIRF